jgi:hypothetical protein
MPTHRESKFGYNACMRAIERRSYLRIIDEACVEDLIVSEEKARQSSAESLLGVDRTFSFRKQLYKMELEARELQREISNIDRPLGSFLHNLNQRMEFLTEVVTGSQSEQPGNLIDLSPGGVSYLSETLYPANDLVAIKLSLSNESLGFACFGRISYGLLAENDQYRIGVQFMSSDPTIETLVSRHIAARQAEERRKRLHKT